MNGISKLKDFKGDFFNVFNDYIAIKELPNGDIFFIRSIGTILRYRDNKLENYDKVTGIGYFNIHNATVTSDNIFYFSTNIGLIAYDTVPTIITTVETKMLAASPDNSIYFTTTSGKQISQYKSGIIHYLPSLDAVITSICVSDKGVLWVGTEDWGVYRFDGNTWISYDMRNGLPEYNISKLYFEPQGTLWVVTRHSGICYLKNDSFYTLPMHPFLLNGNISDVTATGSNNVVVGFKDKGILHWNGFEWKEINTYDGLVNDYVFHLNADDNGNMWVGTKSGLTYFDGKDWHYTMPSPEPENLQVNQIEKGRINKLVVVIGGDLYLYNGEKFIPFHLNYPVYSAAEDKDGNIVFIIKNIALIAKDNHISYLDTAFVNYPVNLLFIDDSNNIWISSMYGLLYNNRQKTYIYNSNNSGIKYNIYRIFQDHNKRIWVTTTSYPFVRDQGAWQPLLFDELKGVGANAEDKQGYIWFGAYYNGIFRQGDSGFVHITTEDGLPSNKIYCMEVDNKNRLWIGTSNGIAVLQLDEIKPAENIKPFVVINKAPKDIEISLKDDKAGQINLYYISGKLIEKRDISGKEIIHCHLQSTGVYLLRFIDNNKKVYTEKVFIY